VAKSKSSSSKFDGQLLHFGAARLRVSGVGNLRMSLVSLDDIYSSTLIPLVLSSGTNREPTQLSNFIQQRALLRIETTDINERFNVSKVIVYIKPVANSFPQ
jgi:hypothetical protein